MTIRIAHLSDTHLGYSPRTGVKQNVWGVEMRSRLIENDFYERFVEVFHRIAALDPPVDLVIHSGDLYDSPWDKNPSQPPVMAQETVIRTLREFIEKTGIPVLILEGNHGLYRTRHVSLLDIIRVSVPGVNVATRMDMRRAWAGGEPLIFSYDEADVYCFPFIEPAVLEATETKHLFFDWILNQQAPKPSRTSIAVAHGMPLDGTLYDQILTNDYDYVALGHDHRQGEFGPKAWYAGSIERWRFDEAGQKKGFLVVEASNGESPVVDPQYLEFRRPVYNERVDVGTNPTPEWVAETLLGWLDEHGLRTAWDPESAARVRFVLTGEMPQSRVLDLSLRLEALRAEVLRDGSEYNVAQLVWQFGFKRQEQESPAYPEVVSEYLIDDPEEDFKTYLKELKIDSQYDPEILTRIAVEALRLAVSPSDEHLTWDTLKKDAEE